MKNNCVTFSAERYVGRKMEILLVKWLEKNDSGTFLNAYEGKLCMEKRRLSIFFGYFLWSSRRKGQMVFQKANHKNSPWIVGFLKSPLPFLLLLQRKNSKNISISYIMILRHRLF